MNKCLDSTTILKNTENRCSRSTRMGAHLEPDMQPASGTSVCFAPMGLKFNAPGVLVVG